MEASKSLTREKLKRTIILWKIKFKLSSSLFDVSTIRTSYIKRILVWPYNEDFFTELCRSVWENLDLNHAYRLHCVRSTRDLVVLKQIKTDNDFFTFN